MKIWLTIEEIEAGTWADGTTYCVLSAHHTRAGAEDAQIAWRTGEECGQDGEPHDFGDDDDSHWCKNCGCGVTLAEVELV